MDRKVLKPPLTEETVRSLKAGDFVTIQESYTARDAAHKRMVGRLPWGTAAV